jgi:polyhydroxybutyrate depolymerase
MLRLTLLLLGLAAPSFAAPQEVNLGDRRYLIDLPDHPSGAMILALHGGGGNPSQFAQASGFSEPALAAGYAVIYPAGSGRTRLLTWNAGYCCAYAQRHHVDDIEFLDQVIADASTRFGLNKDRVYLTGMSNGSMMAETYAVQRADRVKAVAGVSGTIDLATTPAAAVPLLHIHGTADTHVPYLGGQGEDSLVDTRFTATPDEIAAFVQVFGALQKTETLINPTDDGMQVIQADYRDAKGVQVRLMTIEGGAHAWPGGTSRRKVSTTDISANTEVLQFFALHP